MVANVLLGIPDSFAAIVKESNVFIHSPVSELICNTFLQVLLDCFNPDVFCKLKPKTPNKCFALDWSLK